MPLAEHLARYQARSEAALERWLPPAETEPTWLHQAMRYAVLGGGKRIRPVLVYACGETFGVPTECLDGPAAAVELIHAYSLIHDDLPAMDDDDLRRGKPTCHKAYDEATAILAGDAIQALSFHVLAHDPTMHVNASARLAMIDCLAVNSGSLGMAGGQALDLAAVGRKLTLPELENMHTRKTGALIRTSVELGLMAATDIDDATREAVRAYARAVGVAFQVHDDILDVEGETATLGKPQGSDQQRGKPTYPELLGIEGARRIARELHDEAVAALMPLSCDTRLLVDIAGYIIGRHH